MVRKDSACGVRDLASQRSWRGGAARNGSTNHTNHTNGFELVSGVQDGRGAFVWFVWFVVNNDGACGDRDLAGKRAWRGGFRVLSCDFVVRKDSACGARHGTGDPVSGAIDADLAAMAEDELIRALSLGWRDLAPILPWGDSFDGFSPAGRQVTVERNYLWAEKPGGDILCEVVVFGGASRYDEGVRKSRIIRKTA
ncbi:MAG TPA: hypothetical protein VG939_14415 [Caulobacteraceae bacterium]|nr:hypothetical protein [Caulobacteraceae bacterium]